jgi:excisionase family DNA binding protein
VEYWTPSDIANKYNLKVNTVTTWCRRGQLRAKKIGRQWRIRPEDFHEFLEHNQDVRKKEEAQASYEARALAA